MIVPVSLRIPSLKRHWTLRVIVKDQSSPLMYPMRKITNLGTFITNWSSPLQKKIEIKHDLVAQLMRFL